MSTYTGGLTKFYGGFFIGCAEVAICPYTTTFSLIAGQNPTPEDVLLGVIGCVILSTVVPILPELTSITFAIASIAISIAIATMFVTYPFSLLLDALNPDNCSNTNNFANAF